MSWVKGIRYKSFISNITVEGKQWTRLNLRPDFPVGSFGIALDLELFIDHDWDISDKGYRFNNRQEALESLSRRIYYIRYGQPGKRIYARAGGLEMVTLGYGFLVNHYNNSLDFPETKKLGIHLEFREMSDYRIGMQAFINDLGELHIWGPLMGARISIAPLVRCSVFPVCGMEIGITGVADFNQNQGLGSVETQFAHKVKPDAFSMVSMDAAIPISRSTDKSLKLYGQVAATIDDNDPSRKAKGWGTGFPGLGIEAGKIKANLEFRHFRNRFMSEYFNILYEYDRNLFIGNEPFVKDAFLDSVYLYGVYGKTEFDILGIISIAASYQFLFGDTLAYDQIAGFVGPGSKIINNINKISRGLFSIVSINAFFQKTKIGGYDLNGVKRSLFPGNPDYAAPKWDKFLDPTPATFYGVSCRVELSKWLGMNVRNTRHFYVDAFSGAVMHFDRINLEPYLKF
jgi:hypothetical protein